MINKILQLSFLLIINLTYAQMPIHQFNFDGNVTNTANTVTLTTNAISYGADRNGQANKSLYMGLSGSQAWANLTNIPLGNSPRTISIWFKTDLPNSGTNIPLFSYGTDTNNNAILGYFYYNPTDSSINGRSFGNSFGGATSGLGYNIPLPFNGSIWHNFAFTYDGTTIKHYFDGNLVASNVYTSINTSGNQFNVGNYISNNPISAGWYDDLQIYNVALTDVQMNQIYTNNAVSAVSPPVISSVTTTNITSSSATIGYGINANGANATTVIHYGTSSTNLNLTYNCPSTTTTAVFSEILTSLTPSTTYYYTIESSNVAGSTVTPTVYNFTTSAVSTSISNGLVAYYGFENFNSHNGLHNLTTSTPAPILDGIGGKVGLGARFDSALNLDLYNASSLNSALDGNEFTICYWVYSQANSSGKTYPTHFEMFGSGYVRQELNNGTYTSLIRGYASNASTFNNYSNTNTGGLGVWQHVAIVHKSGATSSGGINFNVYINGVLQSQLALDPVPALYKFNTYFYIGGGNSGLKFFKGYIDEFYIYNRALNVSEIATVRDNTVAPLAVSNFNSSNLNFSVYPNPVNDILYLKLESEIKSVEIYSLQGQKILSSTSNQIIVSNLAKGIYLVKVEDVNGETGTQKLIKK